MGKPVRSQSIPPPPPPLPEYDNVGASSIDKQLDTQYARAVNGENTYSNNYLADDDQSVEAQHVVYSFQEEGGRSSPRKGGSGRKRWLCLIFTVFALLSIILALGIVYGKQLQDRKSVGTLNEANRAEKNNEDTNNDAMDELGEAAEPAATIFEDTSPVDSTNFEIKQEDIYLTLEDDNEVAVEATTVAPTSSNSTANEDLVEATTVAPISSNSTAADEIILAEEGLSAEEDPDAGVPTVDPITVAPTDGITNGVTGGTTVWIPLWKRRQTWDPTTMTTWAPTSIGSLRGTVVELGTGFPVAPEVSSMAPVEGN